MISKRRSQNLATTSTIGSLQGDQCCSIPFIVWDWRRKAIKVFSFQLKLDSAEIDPNENIHRQTGIFCWHAFLHMIYSNQFHSIGTPHLRHLPLIIQEKQWSFQIEIVLTLTFSWLGAGSPRTFGQLREGKVKIGQTYFCIWNIFPPQPAPQIFVQF